jgi:hypothetical protein
VFAFSAPLYVALHLAWPYTGGTRYLLPLLPLLAACFWYACEPLRSWRRIVFAELLLVHLGVAAGHALAVDWPRARACDRHWPAVERFAARMGSEGGIAVTPHAPQCLRLMLALASDRPVADAAAAGALAGARWVVVADGDEATPDFVPDTTAGGYVLLRRTD